MADEKSSHWVSAIPELFYDVMARILPGFAALGAGWETYTSFSDTFAGGSRNAPWLTRPADFVSTFSMFAAAIAACWCVGLLLTPLEGMLSRRKPKNETFISVASTHGEILTLSQERGILKVEKPIVWQDLHLRPDSSALAETVYQQLHEYLKDRKTSWQSVMTKNQAEVAFYGHMWAAFLVITVATLILTPISIRVIGDPWMSLRSPKAFFFYLKAIVLPVAICILSWQGQKKKYRRLWVRHLACLNVDMVSGLAAEAGPIEKPVDREA